ncbi:MAG: hypothetical protein ACYC5O_20900 [Anaerolineae bacterium]
MVVETIRDVAIIVLALESIIIGAVLIIVLLQLRSLTVLLRDEIAPMLATANETASIVRGTTDFVGDSVVKPVITVASYGAKAKRAFELIVGRKRA